MKRLLGIPIIDIEEYEDTYFHESEQGFDIKMKEGVYLVYDGEWGLYNWSVGRETFLYYGMSIEKVADIMPLEIYGPLPVKNRIVN